MLPQVECAAQVRFEYGRGEKYCDPRVIRSEVTTASPWLLKMGRNLQIRRDRFHKAIARMVCHRRQVSRFLRKSTRQRSQFHGCILQGEADEAGANESRAARNEDFHAAFIVVVRRSAPPRSQPPARHSPDQKSSDPIVPHGA